MKTPPWLSTAVAEQAAKVLGGNAQRADATAAVAAVIMTHPEYLAALAAGIADRDVGYWLREHASSGDLFQTALFPALPATMRTTPSRTTPVSDMTAADLDNARAMLWNRTENAMNGARDAAERERAAFTAFYDRVRPLLDDGKTVGDILAGLAAGNAA